MGVKPNLPDVPSDIEVCIKQSVSTPRGDWTVGMVGDIVAKYQKREERLEGCAERMVLFYKDLQRGLAKR